MDMIVGSDRIYISLLVTETHCKERLKKIPGKPNDCTSDPQLRSHASLTEAIG